MAALLAVQLFVAVYWVWLPPAGDEAIHIYNATRVASGQFPYVDFFSYLTPLTYLLGGTMVWLTDAPVLTLRVAMSALSLCSFFLFYKFLKTQLKPQDEPSLWLFLTSYVAATVLTSSYFSHHNLDNALFVTILLYAVSFTHHPKYIYGLGTLIGGASLVHQAHGFSYFIATTIYIGVFSSPLAKERLLSMARFLTPLVVTYAVFALVLYRLDSLGQFIDGAILWNLDTYSKKLAFSPFEDTLYDLRRNPGIEQYLFLATKTAIFLAIAALAVAIAKGDTRASLGGKLLLALLIIFFIVSRTNTLANFSAYYVIVFAFLGLYIILPKGNWIPILLSMLLLVQMVRVFSFPVRYHASLFYGIANLQPVGSSQFFPGADTNRLLSIAKTVQHLDLKEAVVIGRSPEVYFLFGIRNPSRYDVAIPLYLDERQVKEVIASMRSTTVIYDKTFDHLSKATDFFDFHHYRSGENLKPEIENSTLLQQMREMRRVYSDQYVNVLTQNSTR
jgi:hypothetical protein